MPKPLDLLTWLEENARPSWKFEVILDPTYPPTAERHMHSLEERIEKFTGKTVRKIRELIEEYDRELPELGGWFGFDDPITEAEYRVEIYVPRRNGGYLTFGAWRMNTNLDWYVSSDEPKSKKDKVLDWEDAFLKYSRKPKTAKPTKKQSAPRKTRR